MRSWLVVAITVAAALSAAPVGAQTLFRPLLAGAPAGEEAAQPRPDASTSNAAVVDGLDSAVHSVGDAAGRALLAADETGIVAALLEVRDLVDWTWMVPGAILALALAWWLLRSRESAASGRGRRTHDASAVEEAMARALEAHAAKQAMLERAGVRRGPAAAR